MIAHDAFYYAAGVGFLFLAKANHLRRGYATPKPYLLSEVDRCIEYDLQVVDRWLARLGGYTDGEVSVAGKDVLELGPGSDLGIGLYLLARGCSRYNACDVHDLMKAAPDEFYEQFLKRLAGSDVTEAVGPLREELRAVRAGNPSRLNYLVRQDFDILSAFGACSMDLVLSQAAFEHFDDIDGTIAQLSAVCHPGAVLVAEIDLKTHTRWIRDKDPNNIYRYPSWLYDLFRFRGIPNRVRPGQYRDALERHGWTDVEITPCASLRSDAFGLSGLHRDFAGAENQMEQLSIMLCARKTTPARRAEGEN